MADYIYPEGDFVGLTAPDIHLTALHQEVLGSAISPEVLIGISQEGGFVTFTFDVALDAGDETILDGLVAAHTGEYPEQQDRYFDRDVFITNDLTIGGSIIVIGTVDGVDVGSPKHSIEVDAEQYQLVGDAAAPGNSYYYGTNGVGTKGYYPFPENGGDDVEYAASEGESSRTHSTYTQKVSLAFTAEASDYLILVSAEIAALATDARVKVRAQVDNNDTFLEVDDLPDAGEYQGWGTVGIIYRKTLDQGARTIDLDYAAFESSREVKIRRARITAWKVT